MHQVPTRSVHINRAQNRAFQFFWRLTLLKTGKRATLEGVRLSETVRRRKVWWQYPNCCALSTASFAGLIDQNGAMEFIRFAGPQAYYTDSIGRNWSEPRGHASLTTSSGTAARALGRRFFNEQRYFSNTISDILVAGKYRLRNWCLEN